MNEYTMYGLVFMVMAWAMVGLRFYVLAFFCGIVCAAFGAGGLIVAVSQ